MVHRIAKFFGCSTAPGRLSIEQRNLPARSNEVKVRPDLAVNTAAFFFNDHTPVAIKWRKGAMSVVT